MHDVTRRDFLARSAAALAGLSATEASRSPAAPLVGSDIVATIRQEIVRRGGNGRPTWFSARACTVPRPGGRSVLMTLQPIHGSDFFGPVHWMATSDLGRTWSEPLPIPSLGRRPAGPGLEEGVCDVVPGHHPATNTLLAIGHNVFYRPQGFFRPQPPRRPIYAVRDPPGLWSEARALEWNDPRGSDIYTCNCAQRVNLENGDLLIPLSFRPQGRPDAAVATALVSFDGRRLAIRHVGPELRLRVERGLLEPSLVRFDGRYYLTLRAEDNHGYVTTSDDGLRWAPIRAWTWDDGEPLVMSTTQQRWLVHSDALYLVYTRKSLENDKVFRWRAPLYLAMVDRMSLRLMRSTERIAMPLEGDAAGRPQYVEQLGNFHTVAADPSQSWITVGAFAPATFQGPLRLSRVFWSRPNRS